MYLVLRASYYQCIFIEYALKTSRQWMKESCKYVRSLEISYHIWLCVGIDLNSHYSTCKGVAVEESTGNHPKPMDSEPTPPQFLIEMTHFPPEEQQPNSGLNFGEVESWLLSYYETEVIRWSFCRLNSILLGEDEQHLNICLSVDNHTRNCFTLYPKDIIGITRSTAPSFHLLIYIWFCLEITIS